MNDLLDPNKNPVKDKQNNQFSEGGCTFGKMIKTGEVLG